MSYLKISLNSASRNDKICEERNSISGGVGDESFLSSLASTLNRLIFEYYTWYKAC